MLPQAVKQLVFKELKGDIEHKGYGQAGDHAGEHAPNVHDKAQQRAKILHCGEQYNRKYYYQQDDPHVLPVELQRRATSILCLRFYLFHNTLFSAAPQ